jgi:hypothetical protein
MVGNCIIKGALEDRALRFPDQPFSYSRAKPARRRRIGHAGAELDRGGSSTATCARMVPGASEIAATALQRAVTVGEEPTAALGHPVLRRIDVAQ